MLAIEARQQERLAKFTVTTYKTTVERIRARFEQGVRSSLDLRLAEASLAGAKANVAELITAANLATRQLEVLLGRIPSNKLMIPEELPSMPAAVPAGVPAKLLARRPDLVAAEHRLSAAGASVRQAKASLYPQISLTASTGTSTSDLSELVSGDSLIWTLGSNLMQPVFQGGRLRQNVKMQRAHFKAAEAGFRSAVLNALGEVENALDAESHLAMMDESLGEAHKQSQAAAQIALERYDRGRKTSSPCLRRGGARSMPRAAGDRCRLRLDNRINLHLAGAVLNQSRNMESSTKPNRLLRIGLTIGVLAVGVVGSMLTIKFKTKAESKPSERKLPSVRVVTAKPGSHTYQIQSQGTALPRTTIGWSARSAARWFPCRTSSMPVRFSRRTTCCWQSIRATTSWRSRRPRQPSHRPICDCRWRRGGSRPAPVATGKWRTAGPRTATGAGPGCVGSRKGGKEAAQRNVERCEMRAPFDGMVAKAVVRPGQFASLAMPLGRFLNRCCRGAPAAGHWRFGLYRVAAAGETFASGQAPRVTLTSQAGDQLEWQGRIVRSETIDPVNRMVYVIAGVEDPYRLAKRYGAALRLGTFVRGSYRGPHGGELRRAAAPSAARKGSRLGC